MAVYYTTANKFTGFTASTAAGGSNGTTSAGAGTVVFIDSSKPGSDLHVYQPFTFSQDTTASFDAITVSNGAPLIIGGGSSITLTGALTVTGNSTVYVLSKNNTGMAGGVWAGVGSIIQAASVEVDSGSTISADGQGYSGGAITPGNGPGGGTGDGIGGSYGGVGGGNAASSTYGSPLHPLDLGSSGGGLCPSGVGYCQYAGAGGGAIRLIVSGALTNNGAISANGTDGSGPYGAGGGAGGSVYVTTMTLAGGGVFTANGGSGGGANGGSGGRIAVYYVLNNGVTAANLSTTGGQSNGGAGTAALSNTPQFLWLKPVSSIFHGTEQLEWTADAVDTTKTTVDVVVAGKDAFTLASGQFPISSMSWDTATVADSRYDLQLVYRDSTGAILTQLPRSILVNNSIVWHSGMLQNNETWTADRVNGIDGNVIVPKGVTLTIAPGAIVKVAAGFSIIVQDGGILNAQGTDAQKVIFTTLEDDSVGGDSNLDGNNSMPTPGEWPGVVTQGSGQFNTNSDTLELYTVAAESGSLSASQIWMGAQLYRITSNLTVPSGVTLTIQPGAVLKFDPNTALVVSPGGHLVAQGTVAQPIYFTSIKDDSIGGDTNGDGNSTSPAAGDWWQIYVDDQAKATLDHVYVRYGGNPNNGGWDAMIRSNGSANVKVSNSFIQQSLYDGILTMGGTLSLTSSVVSGTDRAVNAQGSSIVHVLNSSIDGNNTGILVHGGTVDVANSIVSNQKAVGINLCCSGVLTSVADTDVWTAATNVANYSGTPDVTGESGNISANPNYLNQPQGDFRLGYLSPAIDAAKGAVAPATDIMGAPRYSDPRTATKTGTPSANGAYPDMGAYEFVATAASNIDFVVATVEGPLTAMAGSAAKVNWTITNIGSEPAVGPWHDDVYLVRNAETDPVEVFAGDVLSGQGVTLGPGQSHNGSAIIRVPGSVVGNHRWEVKTNTHGDVFEGQNTANNTGISQDTISLDLPELTPGAAPLPYTFASVGQSWWFKLNAGAGKSVETDLALASKSSGSVELHIGQGYVPDATKNDFSQSQWNSASVSAVIPNTTSETYYITANAQMLASASAPFTIAAKSLPFSLRSVSPTAVGNGAPATIEFIGAQLAGSGIYQIVGPDSVAHNATSVNVQDEGHVFATFAMTGWPAGSYAASVTENASTLRLANAIAVSSAASNQDSGPIQYSVDAPADVRAGYGGNITIHYQNISSDDVMAPLMWITADTASLSLIPPACTGCSPNFPLQYRNSGAPGFLLGINQSGPAGILPAGASGQLTIYEAPTISRGDTNFTLKTITDPDDTIDWAASQSALQPPYVPNAAWAATYANFKAAVGTTAGQYNALLALDATSLSNQGTYEYLGSALMAFEFEKAGLSSFTRRYTLGAMGMGMSHPYDIYGDIGSLGLAIHYPVGKTRIFTADPTTPNHYIGVAGDYGSLTTSATDASWALTEQNGIVFHLTADPTTSGRFRLDHIKDLNGNQINLSYTGSQLTSVTDSRNDTLTYTWNSQGLISQMTDPVGRTTSYTYDTANHLLTITDAKGTTSLTWITGKGAAVENAIGSIGYSNGAHSYFEYDSHGRTSRFYRDGKAYSTTIAYDSSGGATITNANGSSYTLAFSELGSLGQYTDPLGSTTQIGYNPEGNLSSLIEPDGSASFGGYDGKGNPASVRDGLGNQFDIAYGAAGRPTSSTDRLGNVATFTLDAHQNPTAITYADGSSEQVTRDTQGNIASYANRRGHQSTMTYDSKGLLTNKVYADGAQVNYSYDSHRNLISTAVTGSATTLVRHGRALARMHTRSLASASTAVPNGTTSYTYDGADRVTSITYPSGGSLQYTYNANGQRASMTDQAGNTVNYTYDQAGRLSQLTNAAKSLLVSYTYNTVGQVIREDFGNRTYATMAYDNAGHLLRRVNYAASGAVSSRYDYAYNANGQRISMTTLDGVWTYQYDANGQVVAENLPNGSAILFTYDAAGNRTAASYYGRNIEYNVNNLNEYTSASDMSFTYDSDGNMTSRSTSSGTTTYTYDDDGQMLTSTNSSGTTSYEYDALGNLMGQASASASSSYVNDLAAFSSAGAAALTGMAQTVGAIDASGNATSYVQGLDIAAFIVASGATSYYQTDSAPGDPQSNVAQVTGPGGNIADKYTYDQTGLIGSTVTAPQPFDYQSSIDTKNGTNASSDSIYDQQLGRTMQPSEDLNPSNSPYTPNFGNKSQQNWWDTSGISSVLTKENFSAIPQDVLDPSIQTGIISNPGLSKGSESKFIKDLNDMRKFLGASKDGKTAVRKFSSNSIRDGFHDLGYFGVDVVTHYVPELFWIKPVINVADKSSYSYTKDFYSWWYQVKENVDPGWHCFHNRWWWLQHDLDSGDPNGKMTVGYGDQGFIPPGMPIDYTIYFENQSTATAPAAKVVVTDTLGTNLDLSTVQLKQIAFNSAALTLPSDNQSYSIQTSVSTSPDPVTVNAALDPSSGTITWTMQSVDPSTGSLPTDPLAGFLPPDNSSHSGEGFVTFSVMPKSGLANGTVISNTARIVFDANAAIKTNTVTNTIDSTYPTSAVNALPAVTGTPAFTVSWSGTDPSGAGIQSYDIWVSVDGGPYALWLPATTLTSSVYSGAVGHTYSFYSLATSNTGRRQQTPAAAATTQVITLQASQTALTATPSTANFGAAIAFTATVTGKGTQIPTGSVSFLDGADSIGSATLNATGVATLSIATLAAGQHSVTAQYAGDNSFSASASTAHRVTVSAPDFTLASASDAMTVDRGSSATMALTVTPQNAYNRSITFSCSDLPAGMTCSFAPASVTPQASTATTTMTVTASSTTATLDRRSLPWRGGGAVFAAALLFAFGRKRRYVLALTLSFAVMACGLLVTGCGGGGGGGGGGQKSVTSTIAITATAGTVQHSVKVAVTID
jgi:YD repeat-containing protein